MLQHNTVVVQQQQQYQQQLQQHGLEVQSRSGVTAPALMRGPEQVLGQTSLKGSRQRTAEV
jgi:hypothetical protein